MYNKVYSKILSFIKQNIGFIIFLIIFNFIITYPLPYYIHTTGGIIDVSDKVSIENEYKIKGSYNLSYVTEIKGNVITCLLSYIMPNWEMIPEEEESFKNETYEEVDFRNKMMLEDANQNAVFYAYKKANKEVKITGQENYVVYVDENATTDLKIGDEILSVNGINITNQDEYKNIIQKLNIDDTVNIKVKTKDKEIVNKTMKVYEDDGRKITGLYFITKYLYATNPKITIILKRVNLVLVVV
jgi:PDZ domain-containing secreted protein